MKKNLEALPTQVTSSTNQVEQLHQSNAAKTKIKKIKVISKENSDNFVKIKSHSSSTRSLGRNLTKNATPASDNSKGDNDKLLKLLHNAISKAQFYPQTAQLLGQAGKVTVTFKLDTKGNINNLSIAVSSHFKLLDEAAIDAVKSIVPFVDAKNFLRQSKEFTISLVFHKAI